MDHDAPFEAVVYFQDFGGFDTASGRWVRLAGQASDGVRIAAGRRDRLDRPGLGRPRSPDL